MWSSVSFPKLVTSAFDAGLGASPIHIQKCQEFHRMRGASCLKTNTDVVNVLFWFWELQNCEVQGAWTFPFLLLQSMKKVTSTPSLWVRSNCVIHKWHPLKMTTEEVMAENAYRKINDVQIYVLSGIFLESKVQYMTCHVEVPFLEPETIPPLISWFLDLQRSIEKPLRDYLTGLCGLVGLHDYKRSRDQFKSRSFTHIRAVVQHN